MNKSKAFTLVEILLALAIIGIIAAVTANQLKQMQANKVLVSFKNCYSSMVSTVHALYEDEINYPKISTGEYNSETGEMDLLGFANNYKMGSGKGDPTVDKTKFARLFATEMLGAVSTNAKYDDTYNGITFGAPNGSTWLVQVINLNNYKDNDNYIRILFDANGIEEGPNCPIKMEYVATSIRVDSINCSQPDRFEFHVTKNAKIIIDSTSKVYDGKSLEEYMEDNHLLDNDK